LNFLKLTFPELKTDEDWHKLNYYKNFNLSFQHLPDNIERIDINKVTLEEFINNYESKSLPVIIQNTQTDWPAQDKWTLDVRRQTKS
jgi:histone arginine demethylase JMJD6